MDKFRLVLDADGVLLNFHEAYRIAWQKAFNELPALKDPNAYWPMERWHVRHLEGDELQHFRSFFDETFWSTMPAINGALEACRKLHEAGYELICVSAVEKQFEHARLRNLQDLGFPIGSVIATSATTGPVSPKADALRLLCPVAFVDDFLPYHMGIPQQIHRALITRESNGTPNCGPDLKYIHSSHRDLLAFSDFWLEWHSTVSKQMIVDRMNGFVDRGARYDKKLSYRTKKRHPFFETIILDKKVSH